MSEQNLQFKISTVAELTALRELEAELQKAVVSARAMGNTKLAGDKEEELKRIQAQLSAFGFGEKFEAGLKSAIGKVPVLGEVVEGLNGSFGILAKGAVGAAAALELAKKSVEAFAEKETEVAKLNQALANSGQYSEESSAQVQELADKFEKLTGLDDSKFINVARTLLQFGANRENLEKYTQGVVDLAGLLGGDVEQAAFLFGKAMQGSTEMLGRYGIQIDKNLTQTEQLDQLLQQAAQRGGGQLTATQGTLSRGFGDLSNATGKFFVGLGSLIAQTGFLQRSLHILADMVRFFSFSDAVGAAKNFENSLDGLGESAEETARRMEEAKTAGDALAKLTLDAITASADEAKAKFDELTASIQRAEQAQLAISQAQTALDVAKIDEDEKSGKIGAGEAAKRRFEAKKAGDEREVTAKLDSLQGQMKVESDKAEQAGFNTTVARINYNQAQKGVGQKQDDAGSLQDQLDANKETRLKERELQNAQIDAAEKAKADADGGVALAAQPGHGGMEMVRAMQAQAAAAENLAKAKEALVEGDKAYNETQKPIRDQLAATNAEIQKQKELVAALATELEKRQKEEAQTKQETSSKIAALDQQVGTTAAVYNIKRETEGVAQKSVVREAETKDTEEQKNKKILGGVSDRAGGFERAGAIVEKSNLAAKDPVLQEAAKALEEAAAHAREGGSTGEEARALLEAAKNLAKELAERKQENATLKAAIAVLATQVKGLGASRP